MMKMVMMHNREVRRVPMDFDWPMGKVWDGYLVGDEVRDCPDCSSGTTRARERLGDLIGLLLLSGTDSLRQENHPYFSAGGFHHDVIPSKDMAELTTGLAGRSPDRPFGHDAIDRWKATKKIISAAGLDPDKWGICPTCKGHAVHPDDLEKSENWKPTEPPTGEGYQAWETTSEGSPISPVFSTLEELCEWMAKTEEVVGGKHSAGEWKEILTGEIHALPLRRNE